MGGEIDKCRKLEASLRTYQFIRFFEAKLGMVGIVLTLQNAVISFEVIVSDW